MRLVYQWVLGVVLLFGSPAGAISWQTQRTANFEFRYDASDRGLFQPLIASAEAYRTQILADLGPLTVGRTTVVLAKDFAMFQSSAPSGVRLQRWMAGVAFPRHNLVLIRTDGQLFNELKKTFLHEYSHIALIRGVAQRPLPRWFVEGFATLQAGEWSKDKIDRFLEAALSGQLLSLDELERHFPAAHRDISLAYAQSVAFVGWLRRTRGPMAFQRLIQSLLSGQRFADAMQIAFGERQLALEQAWRHELSRLASGYRWTRPDLLWGLLSLLFLWAALRLYRKKKRAIAALPDDDEPEIVYLDPPRTH